MKFSYALLTKLNNVKLNPTHIELLIYLVRHQDNSTGKVLGVHHSDVTAATGMVRQSFYSAMKYLKEQGIIKYERHDEGAYYTVKILDNAFPSKQSFKKGYVNLQKEVFNSKEYNELKSNEKYLVLQLCKRTNISHGSYIIDVKKLYSNLTREFNVTKRVVRKYLHSMRKFFSIGIKNGKYYITYLHTKFKKLVDKPERLIRDESYINEIVHKLKIRNTNKEEITETAELIHQYENQATKRNTDIRKLITEYIRETVEGTLQRKRRLNFKLLNKLLHKTLYENPEPNQKAGKEHHDIRKIEQMLLDYQYNRI